MSLEAEDKYKQAKADYVGARKSKYAAWDAYVNAKNASPYNGEAVKQAKDNYYAASDAFKQSKAELVGAKAALKKSKQNPESSGTQNTESSGTQNTESSGTQNTESSGTQSTESSGTQSTEQKSESAVSGAAKTIGLSDSFYRDIGAAIKGQPTGNTLDAAAATAATQSKNLQNDAARREMEGQRAQQVANRNVYGEAGKIASMQNDAQSRQNVQNTSFAAGNAAALKRANNAPDVQAQIARQDQQQNVANERREQADTQTQAATEMEGNKKQFQIKSRDHDNDMNDSSRLSLGEGGGTSETQQTQDQQTQDQQTQDQQTQDQQTQSEPEPEQIQTPISGNPQHVINGLLGASKGQDLRSGEGGDDKALYDWAIQQGVTPLQPGKQKSQNPNDWEQEFIEANGAKGQEVIQKLREGRAMPGNDAGINFDASNYDQMNKSMQVPSDARVKNVRSLVDCLSDIRMKHIKEDFDNYGRCSSKDFDWLLHRIGKLRHNNREYDPFNEADWEDDTDSSVLNAYADHIRNYVYTYKPEAVEIDSRIDPEQEHIGPMAQDIEQVNPACVKETADGVKTVDSARLAMMNAGAIGELARQLNELNMKFQALGL